MTYENLRVLVGVYLTRYDAIPKMKGATAAEFRRVIEGVITTADSLESIGRAVGSHEDYLPSLPTPLPPCGQRSVDYTHLQGLSLADPDYWQGDPFQILLSSKPYSLVLRDGVRRGAPNEPITQNTVFGWMVSGAMSGAGRNRSMQVCNCNADEDLRAMVGEFWQQEEVPSSQTFLTEEEVCERQFDATHVRS